MSDALGPCPCCRRHVRLADHRCPFCGKAWLLSAAAAAALVLGSPAAHAVPAADAPFTPVQAAPEYGVERPVKAPEYAWVWDRVADPWLSQVGFFGNAASWGVHKKGASVTWQVVIEEAGDIETFVLAFRLADHADDKATIAITGTGRISDKRTISLKPALPDDAKSADAGSEAIEIDGKKVECSVKTHEWVGREARVWSSKELGIVRIVAGEETSNLVKSGVELTVGGKTYSCAQWETKTGGTTVTEWRAVGVPGLVLKWESVTLAEKKVVSRRTVTATSVVEGR